MTSKPAKSRPHGLHSALIRLRETVASLAVLTALFLVACKPSPAPAPSPETSSTPTPATPATPQVVESTPAPAPSPTPEPTPEAPPVAAQVVMAAEPLQSIAGRALDPAPSVRVLSADGRPVPGVDVSVALDRDDFAPASRTTARTDGSGTAIFDSLVIEKAGDFRTLAFSASGLPGVASVQFNTRFAPPRNLSIHTQPKASRASKPVAGPPSVLVTDSFGNPVPRVSVTVSVSDPANSKLSGTTRVKTDESGLAVFDKIIAGKASKKTVLRFDAGAAGVPDLLSEPFSVR